MAFTSWGKPRPAQDGPASPREHTSWGYFAPCISPEPLLSANEDLGVILAVLLGRGIPAGA